MLNLRHRFKKNLLLLILTDLILFIISYIGASLLRFDFSLPPSEYLNIRNTLIPIISLKIIVFSCFGLYKGMWRYTSLEDLGNIIKASLTSALFIFSIIAVITKFRGYARSVFLIDAILTIFLIGGARIVIRLVFSYQKREALPWKKNGGNRRKRVLIVGAGDAGEKILREINDNKELGHYKAVGLLDDDAKKIYRYIHGVKVLGDVSSVVPLAREKEIDEIIIAMPSASGKQMRRIIDLCQKAGVKCKTIPSIGELINDKVSISTIRDVSYCDLLGRRQIDLDMDKIGAYLKGKRVLVTGAGGSIGSEFCREVVMFKPKILIMLDRAESSLYDIEMELSHRYPRQKIVPVLGSVTCLNYLKRVFNLFYPHVVFHAAAYKHVPMMEIHPWEAVYNNILGTKNVLEVALAAGAEKFVLISTDKAVRPTNIMGASKRVAEIIIQLKSKEISQKQNGNRIMAVRFGNVIGSAGSVIPLFKKQIAEGGPVTVTHEEVTRYFMTINEAVQLVLQAGAMGENGDIYILKMGRPVKIINMARDLIRLSGFEPDKQIRIEIIGLRPGEKLYEELITKGEGIVNTAHEKLMVLRKNGPGAGISYHDLEKRVNELLLSAQRHDNKRIQAKLREIVPEYRPQESGQENMQFMVEKMDELEDEQQIRHRFDGD